MSSINVLCLWVLNLMRDCNFFISGFFIQLILIILAEISQLPIWGIVPILWARGVLSHYIYILTIPEKNAPIKALVDRKNYLSTTKCNIYIINCRYAKLLTIVFSTCLRSPLVNVIKRRALKVPKLLLECPLKVLDPNS